MEIKGERTLVKPRLGRRLVLFPLPLQGHINPMLQLASMLHSNGFSITILHTQFNFPNPFNYPNFTFHQFPGASIESEVSWEGFGDVLGSLNHFNQYFSDPLLDCLTRLISDNASTEPIVCLITDVLWHFSQSVADKLKLPRIVLRTSSLACVLIYSAYPLLREKGYIYLPKEDFALDSQSEAPVPDFPHLKGKDIPKIFVLKPDGFWELRIKMIKQAKASSGIIWNSFQELEESELTAILHNIPVPSFTIGPFHKYFPASSSSLLEQDSSSISWLDSQAPNSVIYVSFGSVVKLDEPEFKEMAWGLANSMQPFLWVVRPGSIRGSEWLELLPDGFLETVQGRGHIVKWAPQQEVLVHPSTGAFWTHCGWNSTLESICEGVPMICSPCFGDQIINARFVSHVWKIGLIMENGMERKEIERVIKTLMIDKVGEEARERIMCLKEKVNLCLTEGGSSHKSLRRNEVQEIALLKLLMLTFIQVRWTNNCAVGHPLQATIERGILTTVPEEFHLCCHASLVRIIQQDFTDPDSFLGKIQRTFINIFFLLDGCLSGS